MVITLLTDLVAMVDIPPRSASSQSGAMPRRGSLSAQKSLPSIPTTALRTTSGDSFRGGRARVASNSSSLELNDTTQRD
jgi:hypothetical protein